MIDNFEGRLDTRRRHSAGAALTGTVPGCKLRDTRDPEPTGRMPARTH
jgi:hypothetical protein